MGQTPKRDGWLMVLYTLLLLAGLALVVFGFLHFWSGRDLSGTLLALGVLAVIVPAALYPIASALSSQGSGGAAGPAAGKGGTDDRTIRLLESINERLLVSDTAKRIAYREQDRNALRQAIRDDVQKHDYDAAMVLVDEMSKTYGYREEAEKFREEILVSRKAEMERKIAQGITLLDEVLAKREWDRAAAEADKLHRLFPDSPKVHGLEKRVREAKETHKRELERRFLQAAEKDDVDAAMSLMKELDRYLSESEAGPFRETARGVIGKHRDNLGVQFKLAVHDKEFTTAVRVGERIIKEFPNTKMADEVRGMLDLLRERAAGEQAARARAV